MTHPDDAELVASVAAMRADMNEYARTIGAQPEEVTVAERAAASLLPAATVALEWYADELRVPLTRGAKNRLMLLLGYCIMSGMRHAPTPQKEPQ